MQEEFYTQPNAGIGSDGIMGAFGWLIIVAVIAYFMYMQYRIAHKTGQSDTAWWSFIPILNTLLLVRMAGKPIWWFFLLMIPIVNVVVAFMLWIAVAKNTGQSAFWGVLMLIPPISLVAMFVLAYGSRPYEYTESPPVPPTKPKTPQQVG